ncbi:MAG: DUF2029 domain-containing protein [Stigonema ocellatum SAG 48.90 = DSM 106950]|nr:DUF2029 domain-containing protein [Stigonema ocellatum SAG 48.90 = DSM 106950]
MQKQRLKGYGTKLIYLLALMCLALVFVTFVIWRKRFSCQIQDLDVYYKYSLQLMQGHLPYRDFALEYPPLALLAMILPRLVSFGQALSFRSYIGLFLLENVVFCILMALLLLKIISHWQPKSYSRWTMPAYVLLVVCCSPLLLWRYDIFPALLTQMALLSLLIGRPTRAGIWLGFGIAAKLYPIFILPIFSIYYLASRQYRGLRRLLMGTVGATCLTLLPFALVAGGQMLSFLRYHQLRGIQIESTASGAILLAQSLGLTKVSTVFNYGSRNIQSPLADSIVRWLPLIFILAFVGVIASCLSCFRFEYGTSGIISSKSLVGYIIATLLVFIAFGKVFSPQYLIWLLPFAPLLRLGQIGLAIAIFTTTMIIFPGYYNYLKDMQPLFVLLLNLRNMMVILLLIWLLGEHLPASYKLGFSRR